jgi:hypothetical protein
MVRLGLLEREEIAGQARNRQFRFEEYVRLFAEGAEGSRELGMRR